MKIPLVSLLICITTMTLTIRFNPTLSALRQHGISVVDRVSDGSRNLSLFFGPEKVFISMDFDKSPNTPTSLRVSDFDSTVITATDKNQDGKLDGLYLNFTRDGHEYVYSDPHLEGDFSRMGKAKNGNPVDNMLKIGGKWFSAKHSGKFAVVAIDGKDTVVDPNKSPIAVLGPVTTMPTGDSVNPR